MMGVTHAQSRRPWSRGEEIANSISHGIGLLAALIAVPLLLAEAARRGDAQSVARVGCIRPHNPSCLSGVHALPRLTGRQGECALRSPRQRRRVPPHRWHLHSPHSRITARRVGVIPLRARLDTGRGRSRSDRGGRPALPGPIRLSLSWHGMAVSHRSAPDRADHATLPGLLLILAGGLAYTAGLAFWAARRLRYHHLVWHLVRPSGDGLPLPRDPLVRDLTWNIGRRLRVIRGVGEG